MGVDMTSPREVGLAGVEVTSPGEVGTAGVDGTSPGEVGTAGVDARPLWDLRCYEQHQAAEAG